MYIILNIILDIHLTLNNLQNLLLYDYNII